MFGKPLDQIDYNDLIQYVKSNPNESLHCEYKTFDFLDDVKNLTKEVSSFANSDGGNILVGVYTPGEGNNSSP